MRRSCSLLLGCLTACAAEVTLFGPEVERDAASGTTDAQDAGEMAPQEAAVAVAVAVAPVLCLVRDIALGADQVADEQAPCTYALEAPVLDASSVSVSVEGTPRERDDPVYGWRLAEDMRTVTLLGAACWTAQAGKPWRVSVRCENPVTL